MRGYGGQRVRWVATPPPGPPRAPRRVRLRYTGPPSYAAPPRWGFPPLAWRWPTSVPDTRAGLPPAADRVRFLAGNTIGLLLVFAVLAVFAAGTEIWRYALLARSRDGALDGGTVSTSDGLVTVAGVLAVGTGVVVAALVLWWLHLARRATADMTGNAPARADWRAMVCMVVPGLNLVLAAPVLAELEHAVAGGSPSERVRPSRLIVWWWIAWVVSGALFALTVVWRYRDGTQALADGVVLTALSDLAAAVVAVITALFVRRVSVLIVPVRPERLRFSRVIKVDGAPAPPLRPSRPAGSAR
ncbi:uncharacterized protein DUF4328 [Herbihabitans rhizosphaerae]|uniref:Uncharacterized protein DUF4328 n=1 Tax=Herbihabitans rhizosphaerae TaxID=1872711 RepID=A0A4Q7KB46_9PSEU|nr:DUF4328 domain-containing protein [Herbihabitans rhizosphaerae]RZS29463.1 uncharacterized protein DUF4328 [Herbihabitans rhizosphaerae]